MCFTELLTNKNPGKLYIVFIYLVTCIGLSPRDMFGPLLFRGLGLFRRFGDGGILGWPPGLPFDALLRQGGLGVVVVELLTLW